MKNFLLIGVEQLLWNMAGPNTLLPVDAQNIELLNASGVSFACCPVQWPVARPVGAICGDQC